MEDENEAVAPLTSLPPSPFLNVVHPYVTSQEQEIIVFFTFWKVQVFYKN